MVPGRQLKMDKSLFL